MEPMTPSGQREYDEWRQQLSENERLSKLDKLRRELDAANAALASLSEGYKSLQEQYARTLANNERLVSELSELKEITCWVGSRQY